MTKAPVKRVGGASGPKYQKARVLDNGFYFFCDIFALPVSKRKPGEHG